MTFMKMIKDELERANEIHSPTFQTRHEAYAILREEVEEAKKEMSDIYNNIIFVYWTYCKNSKMVGSEDAIDLLIRTKESLYRSMTEMVQIGAMIEKSILYENMRKQKEKKG